MFQLLFVIVLIVGLALILSGVDWSDNAERKGLSAIGWLGIAAMSVFVLGSIIPSIAVTVRRFHDQNLSGWMYLLGFIPSIGGIIVWVFMCLDGTVGPNRFGHDPKGRGEAGVFD